MTLFKQEILDFSKLDEFGDNFRLDENWQKALKVARKHKEKLLVMGNLFFWYSGFKRLVLHTCKTRACLGKS